MFLLLIFILYIIMFTTGGCMKKIVKLMLGVLFFLIVFLLVFVLFLRAPIIKDDYQVGKWYKVLLDGVKDNKGNDYYFLIKKGRENKVIINFYGGGLSVNNETALNRKNYYIDNIKYEELNHLVGISKDDKDNPFNDYTFINIPYVTGDFHIGMNSENKLLKQDGYIRFTMIMDKVKEYIDNPEVLLVTGYSAGGFASSILSHTIFNDYFKDVQNKNVLVDASLLISDEWEHILKDVWKSPEFITSRIKTNNIVLDNLKYLSENNKDVKIMYVSSLRDKTLIKYQNYLDNKEFSSNVSLGKTFQNNLEVMVNELLFLPNTSVYIWSDVVGDDLLTTHTITMIDFVNKKYNGIKISDYIVNVINGDNKSYGMDLFMESKRNERKGI